MVEFKRILCTTDFSHEAERALVHAAALAKWYGAKLTVLHVVSIFDGAINPAAIAGDGDRLAERPSERQVFGRLQACVNEAGAAASDPELLIESGPAHEVIVHRAGAGRADLLVMGTHGRGGFKRLLLGSVTEKVVRLATCPVLTVPPSTPSTTSAPVRFKEIVCPIDYSPSAMKGLAYALELGRQADGRVTVLNSFEYLEEDDPGAFSDPGLRDYQRRLIEHARQRLHATLEGEPQTWCAINEVVTVGKSYREVLKLSTQVNADLIVMGAQGHRGLDLMLSGSNTQQVIRMAHCPVLTIRA